MQFSPAFMDFLESNIEALTSLLKIFKEFQEIQQEDVDVTPTETGPEEFVIGGIPKFETIGLTPDDLDALSRGYAEAEVKEKALIWVKGFISGITM